jgi:hypothetical protein
MGILTSAEWGWSHTQLWLAKDLQSSARVRGVGNLLPKTPGIPSQGHLWNIHTLMIT